MPSDTWIGKGNSAFEVADSLVPYTAWTHMLGPEPPKFAYQTHYVGDVRTIHARYTSLSIPFYPSPSPSWKKIPYRGRSTSSLLYRKGLQLSTREPCLVNKFHIRHFFTLPASFMCPLFIAKGMPAAKKTTFHHLSSTASFNPTTCWFINSLVSS